MSATQNTRPLLLVLGACGIIISLAMGIRHGFGFWLQPLSQAHQWSRETYSTAMAIQNLMWGVFGPLAGLAADRLGAKRIVLLGALLYMAGLLWMAMVNQPLAFILGSGVLLGGAMSCTAFGALSGIIGRSFPAERRSWAFGMLGAAGSFGQFAMVPIEQQLISAFGWQTAFFALATLFLLLVVPLAFFLKEPSVEPIEPQERQSVVAAVREALSFRPFQLLVVGYFVCGFQVVFIGVHMPAYLKDQGLGDPQLATVALALIGLFNIFGSYIAGTLGSRWPKAWLLSAIYFARAMFITAFVFTPLSPTSVYIFSAAMGLIWLSTIPLTNGLVAGIFGVRYLSMLSGFVFLSHQIGSFLGVWLGGHLYALEGSYHTVWMITIGLGVLAGLINLPIRETAIVRAAPLPA